MPTLSPDEARECFLSARVARLATVTSAGHPHLVPMTFAPGGEPGRGDTSRDPGPGLGLGDASRDPGPSLGLGDTLVSAIDHKPKRTTALARLAHIAANPAVCLLVDHYEDDWTRLWWARADGHATVLTPEGQPGSWQAAIAALAERYDQYAQTPPEGPAVVIAVARWSGWQAAGR